MTLNDWLLADGTIEFRDEERRFNAEPPEPIGPSAVDLEPVENILETRCWCGRLLERGLCDVHGDDRP